MHRFFDKVTNTDMWITRLNKHNFYCPDRVEALTYLTTKAIEVLIARFQPSHRIWLALERLLYESDNCVDRKHFNLSNIRSIPYKLVLHILIEEGLTNKEIAVYLGTKKIWINQYIGKENTTIPHYLNKYNVNIKEE